MARTKMKRRPISWFGRRLRELREKLDWSQERLAEKSGVDRVQIARLETGVSAQPKWDTAIALAAALGVTCQEFVETNGKKR